MELEEALKPYHLLEPPATSLLFFKVTSHPSHPLILLPREMGPHPLCPWKRTADGRLRRSWHQDFLRLLAQWARWMDSLRNIEVKTNHLAFSQSLFRQERYFHAAVSINNKVIIVGGWSSSSDRSGEIVNEGKAQITFTSLVTIHSWKIKFISY